MKHTYSDDEVRRLRLRSQLLNPRDAASDVTGVVSGVCGLQSQDDRASVLGVRARSRGPTAADVDEARFTERALARTWCMRGTLHLVAAEDLPWMLSVFGPVFVARGRTRLADLGFDEEASDEAMGTIRAALRERGPLTRAEIADTLREAGFEFDPDGQAAYHLLRRAVLLGIACKVGPRNGDEAYGLLDEWAPPGEFPDRESGLVTLARRYLSAYQPASVEDFASWSGLPMADVRAGWKGIDDGTTAVDGAGRRMRMLTDDLPADPGPDGPVLRLLPAYDTYLLGYANRDHAVSPEDGSRVRPGGGIIRPTVIRDGRAIATWTFDRSKGRQSVVVDPFDPFPAEVDPLLRAEVGDIGRFLGEDLGYRVSSA